MRHLDKDTVLNKINLPVDITKETPREILERHNPSIGQYSNIRRMGLYTR